MTNIANIPKTTPKMMQQGMITGATRRMLICMGLLCRILALGTSPQARMADITAEAAANTTEL
jgi:type IV secretory pathway TrbD component